MTASLDDFQTVADSKRSGTPLRVDILLARVLDDDQTEALRAALALPDRFDDVTIATTVRRWGHTLSKEAVGNWRAANLKPADD